jgi:hypothetical protein
MVDYSVLKWISSDYAVTLLTTRTSLDIERPKQITLHLKSRFTIVLHKIILMEYMCVSYTAKFSVPLRGICILAPSEYSDQHVEGLMVTLVLKLH